MKNLNDIMKQAQAMQSKMADMQSGLDDLLVTGQSGGGMIKVVLSGHGEMKSVTIDPSLFSEDEKEVIEDLIVAAHADASKKAADAKAEKMKDLTGGMGLPTDFDLSNFKMPF